MKRVKNVSFVLLLLVGASFIASLGWTPPVWSADPSKKRVLVLHSYHRGYKWTDDENAGIEAALKSTIGNNNTYIEYMDTKRMLGEHYFQRLRKAFALKYRDARFDAIITTDNNAFDFMRRYRDTLFPGTPVVFCGVNYFKDSDLKGYRLFTGVNEEPDLGSNIDLIMKLHPRTKRIIFINEWSTTGKRVHDEFVSVISQAPQATEFVLLEDVEIKTILEKVRTLPPDSVIFFASFSRDRAGNVFEYDEIISTIVKNTRAPIYSAWDFNLGYGIVGGHLTSAYYQGEMAGRLALSLLAGKKIEDVPVMPMSPKRYMFDYAALQKVGINRSDLPRESIIINLPQSLYYRYRHLLIALALGFVFLLSVISILLINIFRRKRTEKDLKTSREQLRALAWRLAEAEESDRKLLSRELHDQVGQNLSAIGINMTILKSAISGEASGLVKQRIGDSLTLLKQTSECIRNLMRDLRSPVLDDYGLAAAIKTYGSEWSSRSGIAFAFNGDEQGGRLPGPVENSLFRIAQEALTNVVKHSHATEVQVKLSRCDGRFVLEVVDNGIGCDSASSSGPEGRGWGLITMTERALAVGATCSVESQPGFGTRVLVEGST